MRTMTLLVATVTLLALGSTASATTQLYSALGCRVVSGTPEYALGSIRNFSTSNALLLDCPLNVELGTGSLHVTARVIDRNNGTNNNVQCQLIAVTTSGQGVVSSSIVEDASTTGLMSSWGDLLGSNGLSLSSPASYAYAYMFCSLPPAVFGDKSALGFYRQDNF